MKALIIANGTQPTSERLRMLSAQAGYVVCADGGANAARRAGLLPDVLVGDFDSVHPTVLAHFTKHGVDIRHESGQDDTDLEKALRLVVERGARYVTITGATGRLLDHSLGNLAILSRYARSLEITLEDADYYIDILTRARRFPAFAGQRVSIVPLPSAEGIQLKGLKYTPPGGRLIFGENEGTCNQATGQSISVSCSSGVLMVMRHRKNAPSHGSEI